MYYKEEIITDEQAADKEYWRDWHSKMNEFMDLEEEQIKRRKNLEDNKQE